MTVHPCITYTEPQVRTCTLVGQHEPQCDGREYQWDKAAQDDLATGEDCTGCEPKPAIRGYVCGSCYGRISNAMKAVPEWLEMTEGILTTARAENGGGSALGFVPFTALELDRNEVWEMLGGATEEDVDRWVSTARGALHAVRTASVIRSAMTRHPVRVEQENLDRNRCPSCDKLTLVRIPPRIPFTPDIIKCRDQECGYKADAEENDILAMSEAQLPLTDKENA